MTLFSSEFLIFLTILIITLFLWIFTMYAESKKLFGSRVARRNLHQIKAFVLGLLVYFCFGFAVFSYFIQFGIVGIHITGCIVVLPTVLGCMLYVLTWSKRRARAGVVLLDLGRYSKNSAVGILVAGLWIVSAVNLVISAFSDFSKGSDIAFFSLISAIICVCYAICFIWLFLSHLEIREKGICFPFTVIKWEVIEAYRWIGDRENKLCILNKAKFPFNPLLKFEIPLADKSRVEQILLQYLPEQ